MNALSLPIGVRSLELIKGRSVCESNNIFDISLEFFIVLIVIVGIVIVSTIVVLAIKKPKAKKPRETFEKELKDLELTRIKGIGFKRAKELKAASINTISDLATSSAKDLSQKTGISEKAISRWIKQAKKKIE